MTEHGIVNITADEATLTTVIIDRRVCDHNACHSPKHYGRYQMQYDSHLGCDDNDEWW